MSLGSTQSVTKMSTRNLPGSKGRPAGAWGWKPYRHLWADCLESVGVSMSHYPVGLKLLLPLSTFHSVCSLRLTGYIASPSPYWFLPHIQLISIDSQCSSLFGEKCRVYELLEQPVLSNISFQKILLCANVRRMIETSLLITKQSVIPSPTPPLPGVTIYFRGVVPSICTYAWCETFLWYQTRPTDRKSGNTARLGTCRLRTKVCKTVSMGRWATGTSWKVTSSIPVWGHRIFQLI
jgi:hypothetical protein